ncbi:MAG TPA: hypothetical protein PKI05_05300, partial [Thermogutta sp.]|nr:hypothetical protein [Thermogutta sp.]
LLRGTLATPEALASIPPAMLEKYPTLKRFQEALTDAEVKLIELRGQYADEHPAVIAAQLALQDLTNRISEEVPTVIQTIENEQAVAANQKQFLEQKRQTEEARVQHILAVLPKYRQLMAAIRAQSETVRDAQHRLAIARAGAASARSARLITAVEPPRTGNRPVGPGTLTIVAGGFVCGLFLALCVFLWLTPVAPSETKPIVTSHAPTHEEDGDQPVQAEMVLPTAKKETRIPSEADVTSHGPLFDSPGAEAQPALASTAIQPTTPMVCGKIARRRQTLPQTGQQSRLPRTGPSHPYTRRSPVWLNPVILGGKHDRLVFGHWCRSKALQTVDNITG